MFLDNFIQDETRFNWSSEVFADYAERELLYINPIIYTEISAGFSCTDDLENAPPVAYVHRDNLPYEAAFLAGNCFVKYQKARGVKKSPLPDFLYQDS